MPWRLATGVAAVVVGVGGWAATSAGDDTPSAASVDGATTFRLRGCATCHVGPDSTPPVAQAAPPLVDAAAWAGQRREGQDAAAYLEESMRAPGAFLASGSTFAVMPTLTLTDDEVDALVTYLLAG